jgi:hypothetical protein
MSEEYYMIIPDEVREAYLRDKRVDKRKQWLKENMEDSVLKSLQSYQRE